VTHLKQFNSLNIDSTEILTMGEVMRILSQKLPRDIIRHCIQPYLLPSANRIKGGHYTVMKQLRLRVREMQAEKRKREEEIKTARRNHLAEIRSNNWKECCKCHRFRKCIHYFRGYVCNNCFGSKFQIIHVWQDTSEEYAPRNGKKRYVCFLYWMLIDEKGVVHRKEPTWKEVDDWRNPKFYFPYRTSSGKAWLKTQQYRKF